MNIKNCDRSYFLLHACFVPSHRAIDVMPFDSDLQVDNLSSFYRLRKQAIENNLCTITAGGCRSILCHQTSSV